MIEKKVLDIRVLGGMLRELYIALYRQGGAVKENIMVNVTYSRSMIFIYTKRRIV